MKVMNRKGLLFEKLHIIDAAGLGLVCIVATYFLVSAFSGTKVEVRGPVEMVTVDATFISYPYREAFLESYKVGDQLAKDKTYLNGEITSVEIIDTSISLVDNNGSEVTGVHPFLKRAIVTVRMELEQESPVLFFKDAEMIQNENHFLTTTTSDLSFKLETYEVVND